MQGHPLFDRLWAVLAVLGLGEGPRTVAAEEALARAARTAVGDAAAFEEAAALAAIEAARAAGAVPAEGPEAPAVAGLSLRDREAVALRDAGGFAAAAIGNLLGLDPPGVVEVLGRARRRILEGMGRAGACPSLEATLGPGLEGDAGAAAHAVACAECAAAREAWAEVAASWTARRPPVGPAAAPPARRRAFPTEVALAGVAFLVIVAVAAFHQGFEAEATRPRPAAPPPDDEVAVAYAPAVPYEPADEGEAADDLEGAIETRVEAEAPPIEVRPPPPPAAPAAPRLPAPPPRMAPPDVRPLVSSDSVPPVATRPQEGYPVAGGLRTPATPPAPPPAPAVAVEPSVPAVPPAAVEETPEARPVIVRFRLPRARLADLRTLAASVGGALHVEEPHARLGAGAPPARAFFAYPIIREERVVEAIEGIGATAISREVRPPSDRPVHVITVVLTD